MIFVPHPFIVLPMEKVAGSIVGAKTFGKVIQLYQFLPTCITRQALRNWLSPSDRGETEALLEPHLDRLQDNGLLFCEENVLGTKRFKGEAGANVARRLQGRGWCAMWWHCLRQGARLALPKHTASRLIQRRPDFLQL